MPFFLHTQKTMDLTQSLNFLQTLAVLSPVLITVFYAMVRMHIKLNDLSEDFIELKKENKDLRELISEKNDKVYRKIEMLENRFNTQNDTLIQIKTIMELNYKKS